MIIRKACKMIMLFFVFCIGILLGAFVTCTAQIYLFRRLDIIIAPDRDKAHECCKRVMVSTDFNKRDDADKTFVHVRNEPDSIPPGPRKAPVKRDGSDERLWGPNVSTIKPIDPGKIKIFCIDPEYKIKCKFCLNEIGCQYQHDEYLCNFEGFYYSIDKLIVCPCDKLIADKLKNEKENL